MLRLRRMESEYRFEIMPLIDVILLLLTFFIYAMVLMVRAELMPMELQQFASAEAAEPAPAVTISVMKSGEIYFNREPVEMDEVLPRLEEAKARHPETSIYLALEAGMGEVDRGPILTELWDRLKDAGLEIKFVGRPGNGS